MIRHGEDDRPLMARRHPTRIVAIALLVSAVCLGLFAWAFSPRYIILAVAAPQPHGWHYSAKTTIRWTDDGGTYYYWRVETSVYTDEGPYRTRADVERYFHEWLTGRGWRLIPQGSLACQNALPDIQDLTHNTDVTTYSLPSAGEVDPYYTPVACIVVREIGYSIQGFHVVLVTEQMSPLTLFVRSWD